MRRGGYILVETAVALVILSIGALTVHRTIQEAIHTRGQAQDFTRARFLLDEKMADLTVQPELVVQQRNGGFGEGYERFSWESTVRRINVPVPKRPLKPPPKGEPIKPFEFAPEAAYLAALKVTVRWTRAGMEFEESYETLLPPERLWQPPPPER